MRTLCLKLVPLVAFLIAVGYALAVQAAPDDAPSLLISRQLATTRQLRIGDLVRLSRDPAAARGRLFRVDGIYEPTPDPMRFAQQRFEARLHLPDLLALSGDGSPGDGADTIDAINVALADPRGAARFARDLSGRVPGAIAQAIDTPDARTSTFVVIERFHFAIAIVSVTGSAVFLLALMVMLVDERRETVGILRLIGFAEHRILLQVVVEGAIITIAGAVFGLLFAVMTESAFNRFFEWRYDTPLVFVRITAGVAAQSMLLALPLGIAASLIASWTFLRRGLMALVRR